MREGERTQLSSQLGRLLPAITPVGYPDVNGVGLDALLLTHADGEQTATELSVIGQLAARLEIPAGEAEEIVAAAARRAQRAKALR